VTSASLTVTSTGAPHTSTNVIVDLQNISVETLVPFASQLTINAVTSAGVSH
jgi:hypothetical protein